MQQESLRFCKACDLILLLTIAISLPVVHDVARQLTNMLHPYPRPSRGAVVAYNSSTLREHCEQRDILFHAVRVECRMKCILRAPKGAGFTAHDPQLQGHHL